MFLFKLRKMNEQEFVTIERLQLIMFFFIMFSFILGVIFTTAWVQYKLLGYKKREVDKIGLYS